MSERCSRGALQTPTAYVVAVGEQGIRFLQQYCRVPLRLPIDLDFQQQLGKAGFRRRGAGFGNAEVKGNCEAKKNMPFIEK